MEVVDFHNDLPIETPEEDLFGYGSFANTIAKCVLGIKEPNGEVIAIYGPWGSGKSSLVNLVCHDIETQELEEPSRNLIVIRFNSWCYRTEDGIISGFFNEIHSRLVDWTSEGNQSSSIDPDLILNLGFAIYGAVAVTQGLDPAPVMEAKNNFWSLRNRSRNKKIKTHEIGNNKVEGRQIEKLQREIGERLRNENTRILVVIDDIDRLSKKEAKMIFRLIKSVGRIMNIMYLLAYDREVTEHMFDKYSEAENYLEKIIQAGFDLPNPSQSKIVEILNQKFEEIFEDDMISSSHRTYDIIHEIVVPEMNNLRSVNRFINMISVTYQSVKSSVDIADFLALETFRLFRPSLYHAIRSNKGTLIRAIYLPEQGTQSMRERTLAACLRNEPDDIHPRLARAMKKLFPSLDGDSHRPKFEHMQKWRKKKLVRSRANFDSYFIFSSYEDVITEAELQEFSQIASNKDIVRTRINNYLNEKVSSGRTKASYLLDAISSNADTINMDHAGVFLSALYSVAGECKIISDSVKEFGYVVDNMDRIKRLSESLLVGRFDDSETSRIMLNAYRESSLNFQAHLCVMSWRKYFKSEDFETHDMWTLLSHDDTVNFRSMLIQDIQRSVQDGSILGYDDFLSILESWQDFGDSPTEVRDWFNGALQDDGYLMKFTRRLNAEFQGKLGDNRYIGAKIVLIGKLIDVTDFTVRIHYSINAGILDKEDKEIAEHLLKLLNSSDQGK